MARKYIAMYAIQHGDSIVRAGTVFDEGDPFLEGRESFFRTEDAPDPEPAPAPEKKPEEPVKAEVYVQPEQPKRRGRPPGSKNRPRG